MSKSTASKETMGREVLLLVDSIANGKGVDKSVVISAIENALASVTAKRYQENVAIRVAIDPDSGDYETFRYWTVVPDEKVNQVATEEVEGFDPDCELLLSKAKELDSELEIGDVVEEAVESIEFGRIGASQAKQAIMQRLREAERDKIKDEYSKRIGELIIGVVKRVAREMIILDMGDNAEGMMLREEMIPRENFRVNDRVRCYLYGIRQERKGPQLLVSRTRPEMLVELFKIEVPEIGEEVIEIKSAARDPGSRAKIAVKTNDGRIDPIGACVGMRGSRVQAVSGELNGERIDIILWDDNPAQLVINAMAPAEVSSIVVDEDNKSMEVVVKQEQLSQAIGRNGQNVRLASELTGWVLNVMSEEDAEQKGVKESERLKNLFMKHLGVGEDVANVLIQEGFTSIEEVAYVAENEMAAIEEFDQELIKELRSRARDVLLTQVLSGEEITAEPAEDLLQLEGMTSDIAYALAARGVKTQEELAEQSVDDVKDIEGLDEKLAGKLIMAARAPWFEEQNE